MFCIVQHTSSLDCFRERVIPTSQLDSSSRPCRTTFHRSTKFFSSSRLGLSWGIGSIPILALVDGDAYGIDILSVYKYGSARMNHENEHLAAARVEWIGIWATELAA